MISQKKKNVSPKKVFNVWLHTWQNDFCSWETFVFTWFDKTYNWNVFVVFLRERNKFSRKRKKKKDFMDNTYFFYLEITSLDFTSEKKKNNLLTSSQKHRRETGNNNLTCEVDWLFFLPRESFFCFMCETEREQIVQGEKLFFYSI